MRALTVEQAEGLAARTLAAIKPSRGSDHMIDRRRNADRDRVASDLAGLREAWSYMLGGPIEANFYAGDVAVRCSDNLRRTAALYGVTP